MTKRQNFPKKVQRAALDRAKGQCECVGVLYGLPPDTRCTRKLNKGVHFEHILADSNGGKPTLENCAAACPQCNMFKAHKHDTPRAAKTLRQQDKDRGVSKPMKAKIASRPFQSRLKPPKGQGMSPSHAEHLRKMAEKYKK